MLQTKNWKEFKTKYPRVRHRKVEKAIMFAIQRANYFLAANISDDLQETSSELINGTLRVFSTNSHNLYFQLFEIDALIRSTDDLIDEDIMTRKHYELKEIETVIDNFSGNFPQGKRIAQLFRDEIEIQREVNEDRQREILLRIMSNRTSDIDLLVEKILEINGTRLDQELLKVSQKLLSNWQIFDSIITDLWYIKQDKAKGDFNLFLMTKSLGLSVDFIKDYLRNVVGEIVSLNKLVEGHVYSVFLNKVAHNSAFLLDNVYISLINDYEKGDEDWYQSLLSFKLL